MTDTAYITKYALTSGIKEMPIRKIDDGMVVVGDPHGLNGVSYFHGKDWHRGINAAKARAEQMRVKKIASLRKQIAALEKLEF